MIERMLTCPCPMKAIPSDLCQMENEIMKGGVYPPPIPQLITPITGNFTYERWPIIRQVVTGCFTC